MKEPLIPMIGIVTHIRVDTPDVKTGWWVSTAKSPFCTFLGSVPCCPCRG